MFVKTFSVKGFCKQVGLPYTEYEHLDAWGVEVKMQDEQMVVWHPDSETVIWGDIDLTPAAAKLMMMGKIGKATQKVIADLLEPGLEYALDKTKWATSDVIESLIDTPAWTDEENEGTIFEEEKHDQEDVGGEVNLAAALADKLGKKLADSVDDVMIISAAEDEDELEELMLGPGGLKEDDEEFVNEVPLHADIYSEDEYDDIADPATIKPTMAKQHVFVIPKVKEALGMDKVKLRDATLMYQPVFSTSEGSTYHCVALSGDLKFAARRKGQDLSIRVEGPVGHFKNALIGAGFNESYISKGYTSVHFHGIDDILASRTLSAVLSGVGLDYETPIPNINNIAQKGG